MVPVPPEPAARGRGEFQVSGRLNEEFNNGKTYYQLDQKKIWLPNEKDHWPDQQNLEYHRERVFLG